MTVVLLVTSSVLAGMGTYLLATGMRKRHTKRRLWGTLVLVGIFLVGFFLVSKAIAIPALLGLLVGACLVLFDYGKPDKGVQVKHGHHAQKKRARPKG